MRKSKMLLSLALALVLVFSLGVPALAGVFPENTFSDVSRSDWFAEAVDFAQSTNVMNGVGGNRFDPYGAVTRAMVVTVLYRMAMQPDVTGMRNPFSDVSQSTGSWYYDAVRWTSYTRITTGVTPTTFEPERPITREELATMIRRFYSVERIDGTIPAQDIYFRDVNGVPLVDILAKGGVSAKDLFETISRDVKLRGFSDAGQISEYAIGNVFFCAILGYMNGDDEGTFRPQDTLTRAECAQTFLNLYNGGS